MKTQRILGTLWFALFCSILILWFYQFMEKPYSGYFRVFTSPVFVFGAVASIFLFRGARWAHITISIMALLIAGLMSYEVWTTWWTWPDACIGVFALVSVVLLFWPRHDQSPNNSLQASAAAPASCD